jgi:hypothetical protein
VISVAARFEQAMGRSVDEMLTRMDQLVGRLQGPLSRRFVLQPLMAVTLAIRAGRSGRQRT